jgi:phage baseplate assembly protein W
LSEVARDFLGAGWAFPVAVDQRGRIALASQETDIEQAIRIILLTPKGQRMMRPDFGCHIHELVFAQNDGATAGLAVHYVTEALNMWEPRIRVLEVKASTDDSGSRLLMDIEYEIKATLDRRSLVFPFYTIPGEGSPSP